MVKGARSLQKEARYSAQTGGSLLGAERSPNSAAFVGGASGDDTLVAIPAFLTMVTIPLTFSVANGLAIGFISYTVICLFGGRYRDISCLVYALTIIFIARFLHLRG